MKARTRKRCKTLILYCQHAVEQQRRAVTTSEAGGPIVWACQICFRGENLWGEAMYRKLFFQLCVDIQLQYGPPEASGCFCLAARQTAQASAWRTWDLPGPFWFLEGCAARSHSRRKRTTSASAKWRTWGRGVGVEQGFNMSGKRERVQVSGSHHGASA